MMQESDGDTKVMASKEYYLRIISGNIEVRMVITVSC